MEKFKNVVYVRHAESEANTIIHTSTKLTEDDEKMINSYGDPNITECGYSQASTTSKYLLQKIVKINKQKVHIWISPFKRAQQTAEKFIDECKNSGLEYSIETLIFLQEYTSPKKKLSQELLDKGLIIHNSIADFNKIVREFNKYLKTALLKQTDEEIIVIFGHSVFFSSLLTYQCIQEEYNITQFPCFQLPNCSITSVALDKNEQWRINIVSNISHLNTNDITGNHVPFGI